MRHEAGPLGGTAFSIKVDGERMSVADGRGARWTAMQPLNS
jgi:hypothetical protein